MPYCTQCGAEQSIQVEFCNSCGKNLKNEEQSIQNKIPNLIETKTNTQPLMDILEWYVHVMKNFKNFKGRASRKEYWYFSGVHIAGAFLLAAFDLNEEISSLIIPYALIVSIPFFAVSVRRMHDVGRTGAWAMLLLIRVFGQVIFLIMAAMEGESGNNKYGPPPIN